MDADSEGQRREGRSVRGIKVSGIKPQTSRAIPLIIIPLINLPEKPSQSVSEKCSRRREEAEGRVNFRRKSASLRRRLRDLRIFQTRSQAVQKVRCVPEMT
jgi:hypothetical protein